MSERPEQKERSKALVKMCGLAALAALLLPFLYMATVALLLSAYVHNFPFPSRGFLKAYAIPSNGLVRLPVAGTVCSNYFQACVKLTGANHESQRKDQMGVSNGR